MQFVDALQEAPEDLDIAELKEVLAEFPLEFAFLFGSYAAGEQNRFSDTDIAVRFEGDVANEERRQHLQDITVRLIDAIAYDAVDVLDLDQAGIVTAYNAVSDGVLLLGDENDAVAFEEKLLVQKLDFQPVLDEWQDALHQRIEEGSYGRA